MRPPLRKGLTLSCARDRVIFLSIEMLYFSFPGILPSPTLTQEKAPRASSGSACLLGQNGTTFSLFPSLLDVDQCYPSPWPLGTVLGEEAVDKKVQTQRYRLGEPGEKWNQTPSLEQQGVPSYPPPMSPGCILHYRDGTNQD